ncbi:unnamed protein product [Withania somnifera]
MEKATQKNSKNKNINNHNKNKYLLHLLVIVSSLAFVTTPSEGKLSRLRLLLKFRQSLKFDGDPFSTWKADVPPCINENNKPKWNYIFCEHGKVMGLNLKNLGLSGTIDLDILKELPGLRTISVVNNKFEGSLPPFNVLPSLKSIYFTANKFCGPIDGKIFVGMNSLKKLHLANNGFTGQLPSIFGELPHLGELNIQNNINDGLCGSPLPKPCKVDEQKIQASSSSFSSSSLSSLYRLDIAFVVVVVVVVISIIIIVVIGHRKKTLEQKVVPGGSSSKQGQYVVSHDRLTNDGDRAEVAGQKLLFLKDDIEKFDLPDLLKASAEVLGSGVFGSTYKAALGTGPIMVVKRFGHMNKVSKEDFHEHMRRLGRLSHKNLLLVLAFYYRKEEKLLVFEYVNNVSLAVYLHGNRKSRGNQILDWPTRLKIVKGVSKGVFYLYNELPSLTTPHGHLKSSNVLLTKPSRRFSQIMPYYRYKPAKSIGKADVWTLGILILEILTGKFPSNILGKGTQDTDDLATWVSSVLEEDPSGIEVFDKEMEGTKDCEGEMIKLLKIGLSCCGVDVEKRWDIKVAVERIEEVKER